VNDIDACADPAVVRVIIRRARSVVRDAHTLDIHGERSFGQIRVATGPINGTTRLILITRIPQTELDLHGRLWVSMGTIVGIGSEKGTYNISVDRPDYGGL